MMLFLTLTAEAPIFKIINMSRSTFSLLTIALLLCAGCASTPKQPTMTPLEIQTIQTRSYTEDKNIVFRSVVSVFQDLGYTIKNADLATGFIQADGTAQSNAALRFWTGYTETTQTKATAFVERIGSKTHVRLNFVATRESSTAYGASDRREEPILDTQLYQNAFERIENAIFVRGATN